MSRFSLSGLVAFLSPISATIMIREDRASNLSNALREQIQDAGLSFYQPYRVKAIDRKAGTIHLHTARGIVTFPYEPQVFVKAPKACYLNEGRHFDMSDAQKAIITQAGLAFYQRYLIAEESADTVTLINSVGKEVTVPRLPGLLVAA